MSLYSFSPNTVAESTKVNSNFAGLANGTEISDATILSRHVGTDLASGWLPLGDVPDTVTYNGNRSYSLVFNSNDLTDTLSEGMRLRLTRTVSAPTQCADLESGSSQYFSSASAGLAGMTFTDDFTCMAWIKLESYTQGCIISRWNGTSGWLFYVTSSGQLVIQGTGAATNELGTSYQSIPLGKWVHVAGTLDISGSAATMYIDGVSVPLAYTTPAAGTALTQAGDLQIGAYNTTNYFDGKIAQVAVFSSILSAATIRSYMSQTLSGSESTLVSAFSCSNSLLDLNTTNNNDLTANGGALMTSVDSPFGSYLGGTLDYAIITAKAFSTNTTLTVQVPEGCAIPTSGGVSAVAYSTQKVPYLFPGAKNRWKVTYENRTSLVTTSNATYGAYNSGALALTVPIGEWTVGQQSGGYYNITTTRVTFNLSPTALTGLTLAQGAAISKNLVQVLSPAAAAYTVAGYVTTDHTLAAQTTFTLYTLGATTSAGVDGTTSPHELFAEFNLL